MLGHDHLLEVGVDGLVQDGAACGVEQVHGAGPDVGGERDESLAGSEGRVVLGDGVPEAVHEEGADAVQRGHDDVDVIVARDHDVLAREHLPVEEVADVRVQKGLLDDDGHGGVHRSLLEQHVGGDNADRVGGALLDAAAEGAADLDCNVGRVVEEVGPGEQGAVVEGHVDVVGRGRQEGGGPAVLVVAEHVLGHGLEHAGKHVAHAQQDGEPVGVLGLGGGGVLEGGEGVDPHKGGQQLDGRGDPHLEVDPGPGDLVGLAGDDVLHDLAAVAQVARGHAAVLRVAAVLFLLAGDVPALDLVGQLGDHAAQRGAKLGLGPGVLVDFVNELSCCRVPHVVLAARAFPNR